MTTTREFAWRDLIIKANPDHVRDSRFMIEYEFSVAGNRAGDERTHDGNRRVFRANYDVRGAYAPEVLEDCNLTWKGRPLRWRGEALCWEAGAEIPVDERYLYEDDGISIITDDYNIPLEVD